MHFYRVPRLGSYMAIPLEYESCLSAAALDAAVTDFIGLNQAREAQQKEREEWEEEQAKLRGEKEAAGEHFDPEPRQWEELLEKPLIGKKKQYVVCVDTLGQDRELTDDQRRFILETIKQFRSIWESKEAQNLRRDRDRRIAQLDRERELNEAGEAGKIQEEEEAFVEFEQGKRDMDELPDEDSKELFIRSLRLQFTAKIFREKEDWKKNLLGLRETTVLKMPRILQSVFYLLQYKREEVCQVGSNKFHWKIAKHHFNDTFIDKIATYTPLGHKGGES